MPFRTIFIGDIHGCGAELLVLLVPLPLREFRFGGVES